MLLETGYTLEPGIVLLSVLASVLPALLLVGFIYWVDRYEKEPVALLVATFVWGAIPSIVAALVINTVLSIPPYILLGESGGDLVSAVVIAPVVEEGLKGLALLGILLLWRRELDGLLDGLVYGAIVGLGFAMVENLFYFLAVYAEAGPAAWGTNIVLRAAVFGLNHALYSGVTGLGVALGRLASRRVIRLLGPVGGLAAAMLLHFVHNLAASLGGAFFLVALLNAWGGLAVVAAIAIWALLQDRSLIRYHLKEEVRLGTLTAAQFDVAHGPIGRPVHLLQVLFETGLRRYRLSRRFYNACSELAYAKRDSQLHHEAFIPGQIEGLRDELRRLGDQL